MQKIYYHVKASSHIDRLHAL